MPEVTALGEALIDFTQKDLAYLPHPGGAPANLLAMMAKLGHQTAFLGKVGDDPFGRMIRQSLFKAGIDTKGLIFSPSRPTTLAFIHLSPEGERSFTFYREGCADLDLSWSEVETDLIRGARLFHFGSLSLTAEPARSATVEAARFARSCQALVSFDPNYRPLLWSLESEAKEAGLAALPLCDIVKVSEEELILLTGQADPERGARILREKGPSLILVTLAGKGAIFLHSSGQGFVRAPSVRVVDTTGAGDAFFGAFLSRFLRSGRPLSDLLPEELTAWTSFAVCAGSLATESFGAIPALPEEAAILALVQTLRP